MPPGGKKVLIGGMPAARMGDKAVCVGPPDSITKGSFTVPVDGMPAARMTDSAAHGGMIAIGCPTVLIGLSGVAGNVFVGKLACEAAPAGRENNTKMQNYGNCGVESSRQIINQANGSKVNEIDLLNDSISKGYAQNPPGALRENIGGTSSESIGKILSDKNIPNTVVPNNSGNLDLPLSQGRGVIVGLDPAPIWNSNLPANSQYPVGRFGHAVTVTGVEYDDNGNRTAVYINDTGTGQCGQRVPIGDFESAAKSLPGGSKLTITNKAIW
jgi:hypothetical protein